MERWKFGLDNDKLVSLVLKGEKTATTTLLGGYNGNIPKIGDKSIIMYSYGKDACIIENVKVIVTEFKNITKELAFLEGEGDKSLEYYRKSHIEFFKTRDINFNDDTMVVFEIFKVIEKFDKN